MRCPLSVFLWTFIDFPFPWAERFAWRPFTPHEQLAWFTFWRNVGDRMGIKDIPITKAEYDAFVERYEREQFVPNEYSRRVAAATVAVMQGWMPSALRGLVQPAARALIGDRLREVVDYAPAPELLRTGLKGLLKLRGKITGYVPLTAYPSELAKRITRTYGPLPERIDHLGRPASRTTLASPSQEPR